MNHTLKHCLSPIWKYSLSKVVHNVLTIITIVIYQTFSYYYTYSFLLLRNNDRVMSINRGSCNLCDPAEQWTDIPTLDTPDFSIVVEQPINKVNSRRGLNLPPDMDIPLSAINNISNGHLGLSRCTPINCPICLIMSSYNGSRCYGSIVSNIQNHPWSSWCYTDVCQEEANDIAGRRKGGWIDYALIKYNY